MKIYWLPCCIAVFKPARSARERTRYLHHSIRMEQAHVHCVRAFVSFREMQPHPFEMGAPGVAAFLSWRANQRSMASPARMPPAVCAVP